MTTSFRWDHAALLVAAATVALAALPVAASAVDATAAAVPTREVVREVAVATPRAASAPVWRVEKGASLRTVVETWSRTAGWAMYWDATTIPAGVGYQIGAPLQFAGDFQQAVTGLFNALPSSIPVCAALHVENQPKLLYVSRCGSAK